MSFIYKERSSDSKLVQSVWRARTLSRGSYLAQPNNCWDIIISIKEDVRVILCGQGTAATRITYEADTEIIGISFKAYAFLEMLPGRQTAQKVTPLSLKGRRLSICGEAFEIPTFENADTFIAKLTNQGLLQEDDLIHSVLSSPYEARVLSERTIQRHFTKTTGLSYYDFVQVQRAYDALATLQSGVSLAQAAAEAGYTDQPHMTRALKTIFGETPGDMVRRFNKTNP